MSSSNRPVLVSGLTLKRSRLQWVHNVSASDFLQKGMITMKDNRWPFLPKAKTYCYHRIYYRLRYGRLNILAGFM